MELILKNEHIYISDPTSNPNFAVSSPLASRLPWLPRPPWMIRCGVSSPFCGSMIAYVWFIKESSQISFDLPRVCLLAVGSVWWTHVQPIWDPSRCSSLGWNEDCSWNRVGAWKRAGDTHNLKDEKLGSRTVEFSYVFSFCFIESTSINLLFPVLFSDIETVSEDISDLCKSRSGSGFWIVLEYVFLKFGLAWWESFWDPSRCNCLY